MKKYKISDFHRGWFIGNFDPSLLKTKEFEVGLLFHPKGEKWPNHIHKVGTEYNVLIEGHMIINNIEIHAGEIFVIEPNMPADAKFLEDCKILCVKTPSIPGDKYEIF